eukprot:5957795-Alexandrium_andersonii.AAC.1
MSASLVGSEMCIRDSTLPAPRCLRLTSTLPQADSCQRPSPAHTVGCAIQVAALWNCTGKPTAP